MALERRDLEAKLALDELTDQLEKCRKAHELELESTRKDIESMQKELEKLRGIQGKEHDEAAAQAGKMTKDSTHVLFVPKVREEATCFTLLSSLIAYCFVVLNAVMLFCGLNVQGVDPASAVMRQRNPAKVFLNMDEFLA